MSSRPQPTRRRPPQKQQRFPRGLIVGATAVALLAALFVIYAANNGGTSKTNSGKERFAVGTPGPGAVAPPISLASTAGDRFELSAQQGKTVLLYFQEGVGCQPCWNQITDIEKNQAKLHSLGIDETVSITGDNLSALRQKVADERISTPVLADPGLGLSKRYHANDFGMMGHGADGHTFIVVGPDGKIRWRADYGGAPNYTMYVAVDQLFADIRAGLAA